MQRFVTRRKGMMVSFTAEEKLLLGGMLEMLGRVPDSGDDPAAQRLRVPVYLDDPESNDEWWRLMGEELSAARTADRSVLERIVTDPGKVMVTDAEADAMLRVINEGRLALGARFGVEVEEDHERLPEEQREILDYLGWILEELTTELTRSLS